MASVASLISTAVIAARSDPARPSTRHRPNETQPVLVVTSRASEYQSPYQSNTIYFSLHTTRTKVAEASPGRDTGATQACEAQRERHSNPESRRRCGRQGRAAGAPFCGQEPSPPSTVVKSARRAPNGYSASPEVAADVSRSPPAVDLRGVSTPIGAISR